MKKGIIISAALFLLCSCSQNAFEEMLFRTTDDPFDDVPLADSLSLEHTVFLSWKIDEGCDRYLLMRSCDQPVLNFECVYEGTETRWTDRDIPDGRRYVYRLDKTRGKKRFEGKDYAYGYSSDCRKDAWENNDTEERAVRLEHDLICSLPCVRYLTDGKEELDCDWFYGYSREPKQSRGCDRGCGHGYHGAARGKGRRACKTEEGRTDKQRLL